MVDNSASKDSEQTPKQYRESSFGPVAARTPNPNEKVIDYQQTSSNLQGIGKEEAMVLQDSSFNMNQGYGDGFP